MVVALTQPGATFELGQPGEGLCPLALMPSEPRGRFGQHAEGHPGQVRSGLVRPRAVWVLAGAGQAALRLWGEREAGLLVADPTCFPGEGSLSRLFSAACGRPC